ncbi:hypothetical protein Goklo_013670 [Gossypium klotzschianum]|uniref:Uncharacterized protein n=1 Tax=Gossypium klotzschianum TaxID=34286 RepID=A0A7J8U514_9ROSI|nr:hypothetical protein [Gossypium klotzschianum]
MLCLGLITKDMEGPRVLDVILRSLKTLLMTAVIFSKLSVLKKNTGTRADSYMENQWEVQWPYCFIKRILPFGMVLFLLHPCVRYQRK